MFPNLMNLRRLSGGPKDEESGDGSGGDRPFRPAHKLRMRNIFAAPLENLKDNIEEFVEILTPKTDEQYEFLNHALSKHFVFQHLTPKEKKRLMDAMSLKNVSKDSTIIQQGEQGQYLYVIQDGTVQFLVDDKPVGVGDRGEIFGELSLLYDCPTAASVIATTDVKVWRVSQHMFRRIKAAHALENDTETRRMIRSIPFFQNLEDEYVYKLADSLFEHDFAKGDVLATKGQEVNLFIIIREGWVQGTDITVNDTKFADLRLGPGEWFGERAIVTGKPSVGNITCLTDGKAWIMTKERFQQTIGRLNLDDLILKSQDKKLLMAIPLFAYSDVDVIEMELMAAKIKDMTYKKGHVIAEKGQMVVPALYIIRTGSVTLSDESSRDLATGGVFAFGDETIIMTNALRQQNKELSQGGVSALVAQARAYLGERAVKTNNVMALHTVTVTEDANIGMLTMEDVGEVLHDVMRLGRDYSRQRNNVSNETLERRKVLGAGTFGTVWLTRDTRTNEPYALKVQYKRDLIEFGQARGVIREKNVMERMHHPFVMSIVGSEQDVKCLYMIMDLMQGGELGSVMSNKTRNFLTEDDARFYAAGIIEGLSYMHRRKYVYRDLKGENVLLDNDGYAIIVDLGFAKFVPDKTFTFCGTPLFIAPEVILNEGHDKSADIWSYGVLLYEMLTGENPFYNGKMDQMTLFKQIVSGRFTFPRRPSISPEAQDLITQLLVTNPKKRMGCLARADLDIRDHEWFQQYDFGGLYRKEITPPWVPTISNPFDGSNFSDWSDVELKKKTLTPLTEKEQALFSKF